METFWLKETLVQIDHFVPPEVPFVHIIPPHNTAPLPSERKPEADRKNTTQSALYQLKQVDAYFILWRVFDNDRYLELRLCSLPSTESNQLLLDQTIKGTVQFFFPAKIVPTVFFFENEGIHALQCVVLLENKELHRLSLPLRHLFQTKMVQFAHESHLITSLHRKEPLLLHSMDYDSSVVGCDDGSLLYIYYDRDTVVPRFREDQLMNKIFDQLFENFQMVKDMPKNLLTKMLTWPGAPNLTEETRASNLDSYGIEISRPVSCASYIDHQSNKFLVWICQNRQVKAWSLHKNRDHLSDLSFLNEVEEQNENAIFPSNPRSLIRTIGPVDDENLLAFNFLVFMSIRKKHYFVVYQVTYHSAGHLKNLQIVKQHIVDQGEILPQEPSLFVDIIDLVLLRGNDQREGYPDGRREQNFQLWAVFERPTNLRKPAILFTDFSLSLIPSFSKEDVVDCKFSDQLNIVSCPSQPVNPSDIVYDFPNITEKDIDGAYLAFIFYPGQFSKSTIIRSLHAYKRKFNQKSRDENGQQPFKLSLTSDVDLKEWASELIKNDLTIQSGDTEEYHESIFRNWETLKQLCERYENNAREPLSLCTLPSLNTVSVINRESISIVRGCEVSEVLEDNSKYFKLDQSFEIYSTEATKEKYPILAEDELRNDIFNLIKASQLLVNQLNASELALIENTISETLSHASSSSAITLNVAIFYENFMRRHLSPEIFDQIRTLVQSCNHWPRGIRKVLKAAYSSSWKKDIKSEIESEDKIHISLEPSILADAIIASTTSEIIRARYVIARDLFLLLIILVHFEKSDFSKTSLSMCMATLYPLNILRWISAQSVPFGKYVIPMAMDSDNDDIIGALSKLSLDTIRLATGSMSFLRYSLLHSLLHYRHRIPVDPKLNSPDFPVIASNQFLRQIGFLNDSSPGTTTPVSVMTKSPFLEFGIYLESSGQLSLLYQYLQLLVGNPGVSFLMGRLYLKCGVYEKAQDWFAKAAVGFVGNVTLPPYTVRPLVHPQPCNLVGYWQYLAQEFKLYNRPMNVVQCCHLALRAFNEEERKSPEGKELMIDLWFIMFKNALAADLYDEAFLAMMENPDKKRQKSCLREFIEVMCRNDEAQKLCQFSYHNLEEEFERILDAKADDSLVMESPNYSAIAYSYYIFSGNYVQAARNMYYFAQKIEEIEVSSDVFTQWVSQQAQSYLAAINALELVEEKHAWFDFPRKGQSNDNRRRKRPRYNPPSETDQLQQSKKDIDIIELGDIKKEYAIALVKLKLGSHLGYTESKLELEDAIGLCAQTGHFEEAFSLAYDYGLDMSSIFESLTIKCVRLSTDIFSSHNLTFKFLHLGERATALQGSDSERAWKLLQLYLDEYETQEKDSEYRAIVLKTILETNDNYVIPRWLISSFEEKNQDIFLKILLANGCISEAAQFALNLLQRELEKKTSQPFSRWLPWTLMQRLLSDLEDTVNFPSKEQEFLEGLLITLKSQIDSYIMEVQDSFALG
ncbi:hypothetical protein G9A89_021865 [Geosiphon pyriformis]|nr:hypothetical protein G9A89_021865 [Geosiphon pyriformis]